MWYIYTYYNRGRKLTNFVVANIFIERYDSMAELRVFVSSTCYDLSLLRSQLRTFIKSMGYEPIMSDYEDILYDPRIHTHTSCVDEVKNCDVLLLIIGSRFGGEASAEALSKINFEMLKNENNNVELLKENGCLSVTQLEVLKAIESSMPVYTFIDKQVWHDHLLYEKNKGSEIVEKIVFPSIEKQEAVSYIFNFINFVRLRTKGNNIFTFEKGSDIEEILKKQWSGYFQRLLNEQRFRHHEQKRIDVLSEQFEDLKTAILTSIENVNQRETARGIVRYRKLCELLFGLKISPQALISSIDDFHSLLLKNDIIDVIDTRPLDSYPYRSAWIRSLFVKKDGTFFETRISLDTLSDYESDWKSFKSMKPQIKPIVLEALEEMLRSSVFVRYRNTNINHYLMRNNPKADTKTT